ncbi:SGNH/GDSL hydrolase family protein [Streptosporangiaceae bacterium NEAU-GS5]|nr:SGNH/GDSL hydrolase family protein [Streptosporangiaceae bacterium NEAU-GS5]
MARPLLRFVTAVLSAVLAGQATDVSSAPVSSAAATSIHTSARTTAVHTVTPGSRHLAGTWTAGTDRVRTAVGDQTVRMVARISVGGSGLRVRLSNQYGRRAVTFGRAYLGRPESGAEVAQGSSRRLTFHGHRSVRVPAGRTVWSDPLPGVIPSGADVVLSLFVRGTYDLVTGHERAFATTFLSQPGDHSRDETGSQFSYTSTQWYFLDRIAVATPRSVRSVVALGDSITDGAGMAMDANRRWTDYLFNRLRALPSSHRMGVLNAGIAGNRVLRDGTGPSALRRFGRDALTQPGVRTVVVFEGINDISRGAFTSAKPLVSGYKKMIKMAHARGLKVFGATLTPFYGFGTWTEDREAVRQQVNLWIRTSHAFDKVLDFDRVVRDPDFPEQLRAAYDYGDHLHLSDAGRRALGYAIPLRWLH